MSLKDEIKKKLEDKTIGADDLPKLFQLAKELCETDEEVQEAAEDAEDTTIQMIIERDEGNLNAFISIEEGKIDGGEGLKDDADITITVTKDAASALAKRDRSALMEAFSSGSIKVEPMDIGRLQSLRAIIDAIRESLEIEDL